MIACKRCIMNNQNDPDLIINQNGICNYCSLFDLAYKQLPKAEVGLKELEWVIYEIKKAGVSKQYDCIIGVSGGVDSSYLAWLAKQKGLRALLVHCDNGWNSELAVQNIQNICKHTGFELYTLVLDWEEFKDIQLSFIKANVVDVELPYDYALMISIYKAALKFNVSYVLTGHNVASEGTYLPKSWRHDKMDIVNIKDIHQKFGKLKMKTFPHYSFARQRMVDSQLSYVSLLNYQSVSQHEMKETITKELDWRDYGGKHYENVFTRFYQGYILKEKFKIDKRQFHLSVLVQSKQITREEALRLSQIPVYDPQLLEQDKTFVIKKLGLTIKEFDEYLQAPVISHLKFKSISRYWDYYFKTIKRVKPFLFWRKKK
jgi:N-acetyl sugar amidotransferase